MQPEEQNRHRELEASAVQAEPAPAGGQTELAEGRIVDQPSERLLIDPEGGDEGEYEEDELENPLAYETYNWQASEYVHHHKGAAWYFGLALLVAILLLAAVVFKLWLSIGVFVAMGVAVAVYAHKPPRVLTYELDAKNITIEGKPYPLEGFRSFGVLSDESWHTIDLEPTKRFMPRLTMLFGDEDFDAIVAHLEAHLPRTDREPDLVERLTRYLRF